MEYKCVKFTIKILTHWRRNNMNYRFFRTALTFNVGNCRTLATSYIQYTFDDILLFNFGNHFWKKKNYGQNRLLQNKHKTMLKFRRNSLIDVFWWWKERRYTNKFWRKREKLCSFMLSIQCDNVRVTVNVEFYIWIDQLVAMLFRAIDIYSSLFHPLAFSYNLSVSCYRYLCFYLLFVWMKWKATKIFLGSVRKEECSLFENSRA